MKKFKVKGMHCKSCELLIAESLQDLGAKDVKADFKKGIVEVSPELDDMTIKDAIKKEGYTVT
ncbi:MAG: heavy metal-associated domain-containing protein [Nanoarchaeota archaeon]